MSTPIKRHDDPDWVNHCLWLIISREENEAREQRDKALAALLRPVSEV
jgi:hypothetical protein